MIGSVAGLTLHDGYNPFTSGELAKQVAQAVHKLALAKSVDEWNTALDHLHDVEDRVAQALHADRPEFVRHAQQAGLSYTEADTVFRRLEESVAEARRYGGLVRCWFAPTHRRHIMASVGYRASDDLVPGEDGWALSWQYNEPHVDAAIDTVLHAVNELDRVAGYILDNDDTVEEEPPLPTLVTITREEAEIIKFLKRDPGQTFLNCDIEAGTGLCKGTVGTYVLQLIAKGLAHRPHGERKGTTLTPQGQRFGTT